MFNTQLFTVNIWGGAWKKRVFFSFRQIHLQNSLVLNSIFAIQLTAILENPHILF